MSERKIVDWFTMSGKHIPIFEGESKQDALNRSIAKDNEDKKNAQIKQNAEQVSDKKTGGITYEEIQQKLEQMYDKYAKDLTIKSSNRQFKGSGLKFEYSPGVKEIEFEKSLIYSTDGKHDSVNSKTKKFQNDRELGKFLWDTSVNGGWPKDCVGYYDVTKQGLYRVDKNGKRTLVKKYIY